VSATILSAREVFARVYPILSRHDALFKVPSRLDFLTLLNSGIPDFSQIGKFLTVYPRSADEAVIIARELHRATRGLAGPRVPFDVPYRRNSLVHYRYGAFRPSPKNGHGVVFSPTGRRHMDLRAPGKAIPRWVVNPFNKTQGNPRPNGPIGEKFLVFEVKMQRGKGGVYEAVDLCTSPARVVIIKEGRRHGETDWGGKDGYARLIHEAHVLRSLRRERLPVPKILLEFVWGRRRYLALEKVPGRSLVPSNRTQPAKSSWRRAAKILGQLEPLLAKMHRSGWVWRDCKPNHIFLSGGEIHLIDFEGACRISETSVLRWGSPNYLPAVCRKQFAARRPGTLEDDYALGVIAFQFLSGEFPGSSSRSRAAVYQRARCPDWLRVKIETLLRCDIPTNARKLR
jgi:hypothetical protein